MTIDLAQMTQDPAKVEILETRTKTERIIIHHSAADPSKTMEQIDQEHRNLGYACIGYHYYIEMDGMIRVGRPDWAVGAHALGANFDSLGVCLAGNFETELPTDAQIKSLSELIIELRKLYGDTPYKGHNAVDPVNHPTACPGTLFPWDDLAKRLEVEAVQDITVHVNGKEITGKLINDRTYVPLVDYEAAKNTEVKYNDDGTVTVK